MNDRKQKNRLHYHKEECNHKVVEAIQTKLAYLKGLK